MKSKEEFEAWLSSTYEWANETIEKAWFQGDEKKGHYSGGDHVYDGFSCSEPLFWAWVGWQGRDNLVSKLSENENATEDEIQVNNCTAIIPTFAKGDVVIMNSGEGPKMVVSTYNTDNNIMKVYWFYNGVLKEEYMDAHMVTMVKRYAN